MHYIICFVMHLIHGKPCLAMLQSSVLKSSVFCSCSKLAIFEVMDMICHVSHPLLGNVQSWSLGKYNLLCVFGYVLGCEHAWNILMRNV